MASEQRDGRQPARVLVHRHGQPDCRHAVAGWLSTGTEHFVGCLDISHRESAHSRSNRNARVDLQVRGKYRSPTTEIWGGCQHGIVPGRGPAALHERRAKSTSPTTSRTEPPTTEATSRWPTGTSRRRESGRSSQSAQVDLLRICHSPQRNDQRAGQIVPPSPPPSNRSERARPQLGVIAFVLAPARAGLSQWRRLDHRVG